MELSDIFTEDLEDRQDLSQYSFDPADEMASLPTDEVNLPVSQQSSQASEKVDVFFGGGDFPDIEDLGVSATLHPYSCLAVDTAEPTTSPVEVKFDVGQSYGEEDTTESDTVIETNQVRTMDSTLDYRHLEFTVPEADWPTVPIDEYLPSEQTVDSPMSADSTFVSSTNDDSYTTIPDGELLSLGTRELNRRLQSMPAEESRRLKQRRRTLKNRGYAQTCRTRRVGAKHQLEKDNEKLVAEMKTVRSQLNVVAAERDQLAAECTCLRKENDELRAKRDQYWNILVSQASQGHDNLSNL